jgi:hypothetical protein
MLVFLQFADNKPWHWTLHTPNPGDNDLDCPVATYAPPVGDTSAVTTIVYVIRWVQNIHSLFTENLGR